METPVGAPPFSSYSFDESPPPNAGLGFDGSEAADPSGAELRSPPGDGSGFAALSAADPGGAELCSLAPVEVSAELSAANAGVIPSNRVRTKTGYFIGVVLQQVCTKSKRQLKASVPTR